MTKIVQVAGGTADKEDPYVGPSRELRVDESNWEIRIHDGVTAGGRKILARDANDSRYQAKSAELSGFSFKSAKRGLLTRIGDGLYALRGIVGTANQITVTGSQGVAGDIGIALTELQHGAHTWKDAQVFESTILAEEGIQGNLEGDTLGKHYGDVVGDVVGDTAGTHTGPQIGDVDVRNKNLLMGKQITLAMLTDEAIASLVTQIKNEIDKPGTIKLYVGVLAAIPAGWFICDGTNGTPDFRLFIPRGVGAGFGVLAVAGTETHTHTATTGSAGAHTHAVTVAGHALTAAQMPSHRHLNGVVDKNDTLFNHGGAAANPGVGSSIDGNSSSGVREGYTTSVGSDQTHTHAGSSADSAGAHAHSVTTQSAAHLPPCVGVYFIMKG